MREVGKRERKKDAIALVTGQPVYVDDLAPKECLVVKLLRSPHANAIVVDVNYAADLMIHCIEAVYTTCRRTGLPQRDRPIRSGAPTTI